ncbi:methyltransferase domain-containing protein [Xylophilus rhododendri]|uniref:Methyltransferase domain-containing protein n=1 Tax=Xylophilus rhododendri TaxID=2697032 RepID=A0A857J3A7_9BURK|nr:SAM-dependent methyltransferase [Xylophilus rhododendri]QHI97619.1 methyltransferase domain-containing protein [Xylophilus rhododendri]
MGTVTSDPADKEDYFRNLYGAAEDPYEVRTRWYEQRKRAVLLAALPQPRYRSVFEPGCGLGELTVQLAARCDRLLASDFSQEAVDRARVRTVDLPHVQVVQQRLPQDFPHAQGLFDLIVLSEVAYFLDAASVQRLANACRDSLAAGGTLIACDWLPDFTERACSTRQVHDTLVALGLRRLVLHEEDDFLLQVWSSDGRSVAERESIR